MRLRLIHLWTALLILCLSLWASLIILAIYEWKWLVAIALIALAFAIKPPRRR